MRRVSRRQFTKIMGRAALMVPLAPIGPGLAWPPPLSGRAQEGPKKPESAAPAKPAEAAPQADAAKPELWPKLTPAQEEAVKKAVERRERQLAGLRSRTLAYDLEPAFVFQVRQRPRGGRRP